MPVLAATVWTGVAWQPRTWPTLAYIGIAAASMYLRRTRPLPAALATSAAYVIAVQSGSFDLHSSSPAVAATTLGSGIASAALCYALAISDRLPASVAGLAALTASLQWGELNPFPAVITVGPWLVGRAVRSQRALAARLRFRAFELESEQERFADEAVRYERDRIARELHDVIAHSISIIVIQASAGQRLARRDTAAAGELLANIAEMANEASADIAGLTRLLTPETEPLSELQVVGLLSRTAKTGIRLDYDIVGDLAEIPGRAAQVAYRILQEGLTNAVRHAPGAAIEVTLDCADGVRVEIINQQAPAGAVTVGYLGSGHGLTGLAERAAAVGGTVQSGPTPTGGWRLSAALPATA